VIPDFVLGPGGQGEFTTDTCKQIYHKLDQIISDSIITASGVDESLHQKEQAFLEKYKVLFALASLVFVICAGVVVAITLNSPPFKKPISAKKIVTTTPVSKPSPSPLPTSAPSSPSAQLIQSLTIQVLNASGVSGQAASLSTLLKNAGFTDIKTGNTATQTGKVIIIATPTAASSAGQFVTEIVSSLYPEFSFKQEPTSLFDFVITITKPTP
jgi:hypothetical protein